MPYHCSECDNNVVFITQSIEDKIIEMELGISNINYCNAKNIKKRKQSEYKENLSLTLINNKKRKI